MSRAKDQYVWDADGNQYLDFFGGIVTVSVGHCNDQVNAKVHRQLDTLQHVSTVFANEPQAALAKKIASLTPGRRSPNRSSPTAAPKPTRPPSWPRAATPATPRSSRCATPITAARAMAMTLTGQGAWRLGPAQAGIVHAHNAYCYRCPFGLTYPDCEVKCAAGHGGADPHHHQRPHRRLHRRAHPGRRRLHHSAQRVFPDRREDRTQHGGIFISDEVQTGWGRTGGKWFGIEQWGVTPDIMTSAKGLGNGSSHRRDRGAAGSRRLAERASPSPPSAAIPSRPPRPRR